MADNDINKNNSTDIDHRNIFPGKNLEKDVVEKQEPQEFDESDVRVWSSQLINNWYDNPDANRGYHFMEELRWNIASLTNSAEEFENNRYTKNFRKGILLFLEELRNFVENKRKDRTKKIEFIDFLQRDVHDALFSSSNMIGSELDISTSLLEISKATRVPEIQGSYGSALIVDLVYKLSYFDDEKRILQIGEDISKLPTPELLDVVNQLQSVGAQAIANGSWAHRGLNNIVLLLSKIGEGNKSPLVGYALDYVNKRIGNELDDPSLSVFHRAGDRTESRLAEPDLQEQKDFSEKFRKQIKSNIPFIAQARFSRVSTDAVMVYDHSGFPQYCAKVNFSELPEPRGVAYSDIQILLANCNEKVLRRPQTLAATINLVNRAIIEPKFDQGQPVDHAKEWSKITSIISSQQWEDFFNSTKQLEQSNKLIGDELVRLQSEVEEKNFQASLNFLKDFKSLYEEVLEESKSEQVLYTELQRIVGEISKYAGHPETEFQLVESFIGRLNALSNFPKLQNHQIFKLPETTQRLVDLYNNLLDYHDKTITAVQKKAEQYHFSATRAPEYKGAEMINHLLGGEIIKNAKQLAVDLEKYARLQAGNLEYKPKEIKFEEFDELTEDIEANPFSQSADKDLALLLKQLHHQYIKAQIESELGVDLKKIPLRSQIQLLRYLSPQDREKFDQLRSVLQSHKEISDKIINSFLACAEDPGYGNYIIQLAEHLEPGASEAVFDKYLEIAAETEKVRAYITEHLPTTQIRPTEVQAVVTQLLRKANVILKHFSERSLESVSAAQINSELESIKSEIILFASTFKVGFEKYNLEFSDIKNTSYETRLPETLTEADRVRMEGMFIRNRPLYAKELLKETVGDLQSAMNGERQSVFYMLEHNKELVAFMRFDPIEPGRVYAGSLNVRDEARGSLLGTAMLRATLDEQGATSDIEAVAYSKNPMLKHYIEDFGFEIVGEIPDYHGTGELFYKLLRKKKEAARAKSYIKTP